MYKSEQHRLETEKFINKVKGLNYAESTLARKILDLGRDRRNHPDRLVFESLKGNSGAEKARILMREFQNPLPTTVSATEEVKETLQWDSRVVIPIGTIFSANSGGADIKDKNVHYIFDSVIDNNNINIVKVTNNPSNTKSKYTLSQFNDLMRKFEWNIVDPTPENTKIIGKRPPTRLSISRNIQNGVYNMTVTPSNRGAGYLHHAPTSNCQLCLIGAAANFISCFNKDKNDLRKALKDVTSNSGKRMILMDINQSYVKRLTDNLPENAISINANYKSSNGSNMTIVLINTSKW